MVLCAFTATRGPFFRGYGESSPLFAPRLFLCERQVHERFNPTLPAMWLFELDFLVFLAGFASGFPKPGVTESLKEVCGSLPANKN